MSYQTNLKPEEKLYIIPKGAKGEDEVIQICQTKDLSVRLEVFFPEDKYQVITDQTLRERRVDLKSYIEQTKSWRK